MKHNIDDILDRLYDKHTFGDNAHMPPWAHALFEQLHIIKEMLEQKEKKRTDSYISRWVRDFRQKYKADPKAGLMYVFTHPEGHYGIDKHGFLYDTKTTHRLTPSHAYCVYGWLYRRRDSLRVILEKKRYNG